MSLSIPVNMDSMRRNPPTLKKGEASGVNDCAHISINSGLNIAEALMKTEAIVPQFLWRENYPMVGYHMGQATEYEAQQHPLDFIASFIVQRPTSRHISRNM